MVGLFSHKERTQTKNQFKKRLIGVLSVSLVLCLAEGFFAMSFAPKEAFAVDAQAAETALVGWGIGDANGEQYKYKGVNSMVGTLISWNGENGGYISHPVSRMSSVWVIDNKGEMVNGANTDRCPPINFYSKKNDNLSAIKLIAGHNATPSQGTKVDEKPNLYASETFDNIATGTFNGQKGVQYFTVGGERADNSQISKDWAKAIFAASLYSNSGILDNEDFGGVKAGSEYPTNWVSEYQAITEKIGTNAKYITGFGTPFNEKLEENNKAGNYNYIAIKLESDWTATDVSKIEDKEKDADNEPVGAKGHIGRLSNGVNDNNQNGDTLIPLGTTFDANYDKHIMSDIDTGDVYLKSIYASGKVDTTSSADPVALSDRIKNYATSYNEEVRTQQLTFCPAGEGYSFGRLAIPDNAYVILDLNGHKIDRNLTNNAANVDTIVQSVFILGQYSRLEVFDSSVSEVHPFGTGEVTGGVTRNGTGMVFDNQKWDNYGSDSNYANSVKGGGFTLRNRAELTVHSGNVTNNQGLFGGAFYGVGASTVNVFDAKVEGNSAVRGGMCYLSQGSFMTLNMFGGLVQGNSARMDGFAKENAHGKPRQPSVTDPNEKTEEGVYETQQQKNPDGYGHEGGGICVYQESYCNIYGGSITHNYSATFGGGISVSYNSFLKLFGGEITGNVAKGLMRDINGAKVVSESNPKETETPKANVGGAGINMYQDSAGIYLNGPAKVMGNYCSQVEPDESYTAAAIAAVIENDEKKEDSNLYLSLTTSMARYSWNSDHYEDSKTRYHLTGDWDEAYGPAFKTGGTVAKENQAVSRKGQMMFDPKLHLYPEIKVQGPLYRDATHVAQVSITPAAGIEAGGYIMRQFYPKGWEDGTDGQSTSYNGIDGARPLKSGVEGAIDESSHAKNQINSEGGTAFNLRQFLKTGATSGYVDGFLFTDGGTSIIAGEGNNEGWYMALGTKDAGNLPVEWQYYDRTVDPASNKPKGWTKAETNAETGTGFTLVYNGEDRKYDIRVFLDRAKITNDTSGDTSGKFYLYYDYYTKINEETGAEGEKCYYYKDESDRNAKKPTNIFVVTSGYREDFTEIEQKDVVYASERYDRLGYRFIIRSDIKGLTGDEGKPKPFNSEDKFVANPNYATMKIDRATLMVSQVKLAEIERYYDGTTDFYIPLGTLQDGVLTGAAAKDISNLIMQFTGQVGSYVKGKLQSPDVGTNNVALSMKIEEIGSGENHDEDHDANTFPDQCLLANYNLYDLNTETMYPAEDREAMSVTLNVNVKPKPITVELEKKTYEYGSVPIFDKEWGTHAGTANWAETYEKALGGLFAAPDASDLLTPEQEGFNPNALGLNGKLAQEDIENTSLDPEHDSAADKANKALRLDQILKISFTSNYGERAQVGVYPGTFTYTNGNYVVTWGLGEQSVEGTNAQINDLIEITPRKITVTLPDKATVYGEPQAELTLPDENVKHVGDEKAGVVFGDTLGAVLGLEDGGEKVSTTAMLRVTKNAADESVDKNEKGYYNIVVTNRTAINSNYQLEEDGITQGKYTVYPRKVVLTADPYTSVYGEAVPTNMGGYTATLAAEQSKSLTVSSTVIFPADQAAFDKGVTYSYKDTGEHKNVGDYKFNVSFDPAKALNGEEGIGVNYDVSCGSDATHDVAQRNIVVAIYDTNQHRQYGDPYTEHSEQGVDWAALYSTNGTGSAIVEGDELDIRLEFGPSGGPGIPQPSDVKAAAGTYPIGGMYYPSEEPQNYTVDFSGNWSDGEHGTYTITRRTVELTLSQELSSEYGDDLVSFWDGKAYTLNGVVNDDELTLDPKYFLLRESSSKNIAGGSDETKFETYHLGKGSYTVRFDSEAYKASGAYNKGANANYEINANGTGLYIVDPREIEIKIGVESKSTAGIELHPVITYGEAVPDLKMESTRLNGKGGAGLVGGDDADLNAALKDKALSISGYTSAITASEHLRVGTYSFTATQTLVSDNYKVKWDYGSLTVNQREVTVEIKEQEVTYTGTEPNVDNNKWHFVEGSSLADRDSKSIVKLEKEAGENAGKYDITLSCTDNNYKFTVKDGTGDGSLTKANAFVITPAEIAFELQGENHYVYDANPHQLEIYFTGSTTPTMHTVKEDASSEGNGDGSVTFAFDDNVYTVKFAYNGTSGKTIELSNGYKNVGTYTVTVTVLHKGTFGEADYEGNFCFGKHDSEGYIYEKSIEYDITKAEISVGDLASKPYNRAGQEADWSFVNGVNPSVVPDKAHYAYAKDSGNVKYAIKMDGGAKVKENSRLDEATGLPYYRGMYTFTLTLTGGDYKNFQFRATEEGANVGKTTTKDFEITPLAIFSRLAEPTVEFDNATRFHGDQEGRHGAWSFIFTSTTETTVEGISYNIEYEYYGWGAEGEGTGEHTLLVKIGGYTAAGDKGTVAANEYFVDSTKIEEDRMKAILENIHAFLNAGTYTYTLKFEYENFGLRADEGSETVDHLDFTYTITPVILTVGTFSNRTFNDQEQDVIVTERTFVPTSGSLTSKNVYDLLHPKGEDPLYTLSYQVEMGNAQLGGERKPRNAGTYTVIIQLSVHNFAFGNMGGEYLFEDSSQRFIIDPLNISNEEEAVDFQYSFLNGGGNAGRDHIEFYTGEKIEPKIQSIEFRTRDGNSLSYTAYESSGDLKFDYFTFGNFEDNILADAARGGAKAKGYIIGNGNFTGRRAAEFSIQPKYLGIVLGEVKSVYGERVAVDESIIDQDKSTKPYFGDNLNYTFEILNRVDRTGHLVVGSYAVKATWDNPNYNVVFIGGRNEAGEEVEDGGTCGTYTVEQRQIIIQILGGPSVVYSGGEPSLGDATWHAAYVLNGNLPAIVKGDEGEFKVTLKFRDGYTAWNVGDYTVVGELAADDVGRNYAVTWQEGTLTVTPINITVTVNGQSSVYDGNVPAAKNTGDGLYTVTAGAEAVEAAGGNLADIIELYIVNAAKDVRAYQLMARSKDPNGNYTVDCGMGGTYNVTRRELVVTIKDAESYYGEDEVTLGEAYYTVTYNGETAGAIVAGDDLSITLTKGLGSTAGTYMITGSWNNNGNYGVTFKGETKPDTQTGTYTVKKRPITVHINDQSGEYGSIGESSLSQTMGESAATAGAAWYVKGFSVENPETAGLTGTPVVEGDQYLLQITLFRDSASVAPGKYPISGRCDNGNYEVTFEGAWNEEDDETHNGKCGIYTVGTRTVIVYVQPQSGVYGDAKNFDGTKYTLSQSFVSTDSVTVKIEVKDDALAVGSYPITVTITFGNAEHKDWYTITVVGEEVTEGDLQTDGTYQVNGGYTVVPRALRVTVEDLSSVYGETLRELNYTTVVCTNSTDSSKTILEGDAEKVREEILGKLALTGTAYNGDFLKAGSYAIEGTNFTTMDGNYTVTFTGSRGNETDKGMGTYTVERRAITVAIQSVEATYGDVGDYATSEVKAALDRTLTYTARTTNVAAERAEVTKVEGGALGVALSLTGCAYSTSRHLRVGRYTIEGTSSEDAENYDITFINGTYTVNARRVTVTLGTKNPQSEYGDELVSQSEWGWEAEFTFEGEGEEAVFKEDKLALTMSTTPTLTQNSDVGSADITAALDNGENDNDNYNVSWTWGIYKIVPREVVVTLNEIAPVTYGTEWEEPEYTPKRAGDKPGDAILNGEVTIKIDVENRLGSLSTTGYLRYKEDGYRLTAEIEGTKRGNYHVTISNIDEVKYTVNKRPVTITIDDKQSVYGESEQALTWQDKESKIVKKDGKTDDLGITLTRDRATVKNAGKYFISGSSTNPDYTVTFSGSWSEASDETHNGTCGTYTITPREIWLDIITQEQGGVYGETITLPAALPGVTVRFADGSPYRTLAEGETLAGVVRLYIAHKGSGARWSQGEMLDAGRYDLGLEPINDNYKVNPDRSYMGEYVVLQRQVLVTIGDQSGVYGETNAVDQNNYTPAVQNGTGKAWYGTDSFKFTLTSGASDPRAKAFDNYLISAKAAPEGTTKAENYVITYGGSQVGGGTYKIAKRVIVVNINDQSAIYGGSGSGSKAVLVPTLNQTFYTATYNGNPEGAILSGDEASLYIGLTLVYSDGDLSTAGALKAGSYAIVGAYGVGNSHTNYEVHFVGSWTGPDHHNTAGTFTVQKRGLTVALGLDASKNSFYGENPKGPWAKNDPANQDMYRITLTSGEGDAVVGEDVIAFTMSTLATSRSPVGIYPLIGELTSGTNDNDNYIITFTGGFNSSDSDYMKYNGQAGVYNVLPREITVAINPYSREYGEDVENSVVLSALNAERTNGVYFTLPEDWSVNGDTAEGLGVTLNCAATVTSGAQSYTVTGTASNPNYAVTFTGGEGKYTITPRKVYVVILPQASVYGAAIEVEQNAWFAFRNDHKATWNGTATSDPSGVLANGEKLDVLKVRLTKRDTIDGYDFSEGNGTYGGQYEIDGDYSNSNYEVIFVGAYTAEFFKDTDAFKNTESPYYNASYFASTDSHNYAADGSPQSYGVYTIAPRKVTIELNSVSGTYGSKELTRDGADLKRGVELDPAQGGVWKYASRSAEIDAGHVGYLSFYIGGKYAEAADRYLVPGTYPVVAYWALSLADEAKSRVRDWNYEITFTGDWEGGTLGTEWQDVNGKFAQAGQAGVYTVQNAEIKQYGDWYESFLYRVEEGAEPYAMTVDGNMEAEKRFFTFQGDVRNATAVTYGALYFNATRNSQEGATQQADYEKDASGAPLVSEVGYWLLEVTVTAANHNANTFTLVYRIAPSLVKIELKADAKFTFTYGTYFFDNREAEGGAVFSELERALKNWLLGPEADAVSRIFVDDVPHTGDLAEYLASLFANENVLVSVYKMNSNRSSGGYLNAGEYLITISGGDDMEITFDKDYDAVVCTPLEVGVTWTADGEYTEGEYEGSELFTYTYDNRQHSLVPTASGVLTGDRVAGYTAAHNRFDRETGASGAVATPLGYGWYICRVTSAALGGADGGNYTVKEDLHAYVSVEKRAVTVRIHEQPEHVYGDAEERFDIDDWEVNSMAAGEDKSVLGVSLTRDTGRDVGSYKIRGSYTNENYAVTFAGDWNSEGDAENGTCGTYTIVPRPITVHLRDMHATYGTALPDGDDLADNITLWTASYDRNPLGIAIVQGDDIHLTMKISYKESDLTSTGYLRTASYPVVAGWDNGNYTVRFASYERPTETQSRYIVDLRDLRVSLFDAAATEYGYARPEIQYGFTGFTARDAQYFEDVSNLFLRFYFYDPQRDMELSPSVAYDPVGTYAVRGEIVENEAYEDIGANYNVNFVGAWDNNVYPALLRSAGFYRVTPRSISILIHSVTSEYGEIVYIPIELQPGSPELVGTDTLQGLGIQYKTEAYRGNKTNVPGVYPIEYASIANPNYRVSGALSLGATYTVTPRRIRLMIEDQSDEYGDDHAIQSIKDVNWKAVWVTEEDVEKEGLGIVYDDDIINNLRVVCAVVNATTAVGDYPLTASYETNGCYEVMDTRIGTYHILPRAIIAHINSYEGEYGEDHATRFRNEINIIGRGFSFERKNVARTAIAFPTDPINSFHLVLDTKENHVGVYPITCVYEDRNYSVELMGDFLDGEGNVLGGTYRITPRKITVKLNNQSGEYGDDHTPVNRRGETWTASRFDGGAAIIESDDLGLTLSTDATERSGVGAYTVTATCGNPDYEVTEYINGTYTVTPRKLTASVYGESEYGDPLQETELVFERPAGLGGPGIMPWDEAFLSIEAQCDAYVGAPAGSYPVTYKIIGGSNENYEISDSAKGEYVIRPREIVVDIGEYTQTYGDPTHENDLTSLGIHSVSRANGKDGDAILGSEIGIVLRALGFSRNVGTYIVTIERVTDPNYHVTVNNGTYTITRRAITAHIDDKRAAYAGDERPLTVSAVEGLVEGDDLGLTYRVDWGDDLVWHNVGDYPIYVTYSNLNYDVTFSGSWAGDVVAGTYTIYKAGNIWVKDYTGDGTLVQGKQFGEDEMPRGRLGDTVIRFYYDEACTREIEGDISEMEVGVYYAKATVEDTANYTGLERSFAIQVLSGFLYSQDTVDITLFVCLYGSQFVAGIGALLFIRKRKAKKAQ